MKSKTALLKLCFKYLPTIDDLFLNCDEEDQELLHTIQKDLNILEFLKKLFINVMPLRLTVLQDEYYLAIPSTDIRRPDALLPITKQEYKLLREWLTDIEKELDTNLIACPQCGSRDVEALYGTINLDGSGNVTHYICNNCHKEFEA